MFEHITLVNPIFQALLAVFVAVAISASVALPTPREPVPILQRTEIRDKDGQFALSYLTGDGTAVAQQGALKPTADGKDNVLVTQVSVLWKFIRTLNT